VAIAARATTSLSSIVFQPISWVMRRDVAPVVAAEVLLRHGFDDDSIASYLARTWPLDDNDCRAAVQAAHVLVRRESTRQSSS
jgi:hypothetical protein